MTTYDNVSILCTRCTFTCWKCTSTKSMHVPDHVSELLYPLRISDQEEEDDSRFMMIHG